MTSTEHFYCKKFIEKDLENLSNTLEQYMVTFSNELSQSSSLDKLEKKLFAINVLKKTTNYLSIQDAKIEIQRTLALPNDGHSGTSLLYGNCLYNDFIEEILPLYFEFFNQELWCLGAFGEENTNFINSRLISINGFSVSEMLEAFKLIIGYDNIFNAQSKFQKHISSVIILRAIGVVSKTDSTAILMLETVEGIVFEKQVECMNKNTPSYISDRLIKTAKESEIPTSRFNAAKGLMLYEIPEIHSICAKVGDLRLSEEQKRKFYFLLKNRIEALNPQKIIIDYRGNEGGTGFLNDEWLNLLIEHGQRYNSLIVITDINTFSLATKQAAWLKLAGNALVVGEPSGGNFWGYSSPQTYIMESLNISYNLSTERFNESKGFNLKEITNKIGNFEALKPDKEIYSTIQDYIEGKDTIFKYISTL